MLIAKSVTVEMEKFDESFDARLLVAGKYLDRMKNMLDNYSNDFLKADVAPESANNLTIAYYQYNATYYQHMGQLHHLLQQHQALAVEKNAAPKSWFNQDFSLTGQASNLYRRNSIQTAKLQSDEGLGVEERQRRASCSW